MFTMQGSTRGLHALMAARSSGVWMTGACAAAGLAVSARTSTRAKRFAVMTFSLSQWVVARRAVVAWTRAESRRSAPSYVSEPRCSVVLADGSTGVTGLRRPRQGPLQKQQVLVDGARRIRVE